MIASCATARRLLTSLSVRRFWQQQQQQWHHQQQQGRELSLQQRRTHVVAHSASSGRRLQQLADLLSQATAYGRPRFFEALQQSPELAAAAQLMLTAPVSRLNAALASHMTALQHSAHAAIAPDMIRACGPLPPQASILCLGYSPPTLLDRLVRTYSQDRAAAGAPVQGLDWSHVSLEQANSHFLRCGLAPRVALGLADVAAGLGSTGLAEASVDAIFSLHKIYFWRSVQAGLEECWRLLKPQGRLILGMAPARYARLFNAAGVNAEALQRGYTRPLTPPGQAVPVETIYLGMAATANERQLQLCWPSLMVNLDAAEILSAARRVGFSGTESAVQVSLSSSAVSKQGADDSDDSENAHSSWLLGRDTGIFVLTKGSPGPQAADADTSAAAKARGGKSRQQSGRG